MKKDEGQADKKLTVLSLFSGGGGLDAGLHSTGRYVTIACVEKAKPCCDTLEANINAGRLDRDCRVIRANISKLQSKRLLKDLGVEPGEVDLVAGGPPCQGWSRAGKRLGPDDPRAKLLWDYAGILQVIRPRAFVLENVEGMLDHFIEEEGEQIPVVEKFARLVMDAPGRYSVKGWVLDSADFGTPQHRKRVILVGNRVGADVVIRSTYGPPEIAAKGLCKPWVTVRDAIGSLKEPVPRDCRYNPDDEFIFTDVPEGGTWKNLPKSHLARKVCEEFPEKKRQSAGRRLAWDRPSWTICTDMKQLAPGFCHPSETRPLTTREAATIQGFPLDWEFRCTDTPTYRQIGNAVPSQLAAGIGEAIANALDGANGKPGRKPRDWKGIQVLRWTKKGLRQSRLKCVAAPVVEPLDETKKKELQKLEKRVSGYVKQFSAAGEALKIIRDDNLHRETHKNFEDYCLDKYGFGRHRARRLIKAHEAYENVAKLATSEQKPINEGQLRELATLKSPEDQARAWDCAVEAALAGGESRVTGDIADAIVREMFGKGKNAAKKHFIFSLGGAGVRLSKWVESSPESVLNAFDWSSRDMTHLLMRASEMMDDDARSEVREVVRKNAEQLIEWVDHDENLAFHEEAFED